MQIKTNINTLLKEEYSDLAPNQLNFIDIPELINIALTNNINIQRIENIKNQVKTNILQNMLNYYIQQCSKNYRLSTYNISCENSNIDNLEKLLFGILNVNVSDRISFDVIMSVELI